MFGELRLFFILGRDDHFFSCHLYLSVVLIGLVNRDEPLHVQTQDSRVSYGEFSVLVFF